MLYTHGSSHCWSTRVVCVTSRRSRNGDVQQLQSFRGDHVVRSVVSCLVYVGRAFGAKTTLKSARACGGNLRQCCGTRIPSHTHTHPNTTAHKAKTTSIVHTQKQQRLSHLRTGDRTRSLMLRWPATSKSEHYKNTRVIQTPRYTTHSHTGRANRRANRRANLRYIHAASSTSTI